MIGGSGLIESKLVTRLNEDGHEAVAASPNYGVNTLTGEGLAEVLAGAAIVAEDAGSIVSMPNSDAIGYRAVRMRA